VERKKSKAVPQAMKQYLQIVDYALWIAVMAMQWGLLAYALHRKLWRQSPFFMAFLSFVALQSSASFLISQYLSYSSYVVAFYAGMAMETVLLLMVVYEVFRVGFNPIGVLPSGTVARIVAFLGAIVVGSVSLALWKPAVSSDAFFALAKTCHRSAEFVVCCALWSIILYARSLAIPWQTRIAGIARGFLFYLTVQAFTTAGIALSSGAVVTWLSRVGIASYFVALVLWFRAARQQDEISMELPAPEVLIRLKDLVGEMRAGNPKPKLQERS
jgi:hypothetical protein